jgi:EmrB/QacA subfamily drug resistance transporter
MGTAVEQPEQTRGDARASVPSSERWLLVAIGLGTTLAPVNSTMIAVALPNIQSDLGVSVSQTAWLVTLYLVAMAVGQPIGGRIGDLAGRRRVYLIGLAWFGLASAACALAPNLAVLVLFRTMQAMAGALTFPNGAAMVRQAVPRERRGTAFGVVGMMTAMAAAIGPPLGGVLVHAFDWRAIFWVNVPIVALALWLNARTLPATPGNSSGRTAFDWLGSLLFGLTLAAFIAIPAMIRVDRTPLALAALAGSLLLGVFFVRWELRRAHPVVEMRLFRERAFSASCASIALSNFVMYTTLLALPLFMDHVRGDNERTIGLTLAAMSALSALWGLLGGRISDQRGRWLPAVAGALGLLLGIGMLAGVLDAAQLWPIALALAVMGIGLGVQSAPVQTSAVEAAPMDKTGAAAGVYSTSRYLGSVIGATVLAVVFTSDPVPGDAGRFQWLFAGLAIAAVAGVFANSQIASRRV